jgi:hypothetical protein
MSAGKALKCITSAFAVLGMVSGVCQIMGAVEENEVIEIVKGAMQTASSILLLIGALAFAPLATAIGALLAIGLALWEITDMIIEANRPHCENVFRKIVEDLKKKKIKTYREKDPQNVIELLKCKSEFEQLQKAIDAMAWFPLKDDPENPKQGEAIRKSLSAVGFSKSTIDAILEPIEPPVDPRFLPPIPIM